MIKIAALPARCGLCQGDDNLLFCSPCFGFHLCGHRSCQSCFKLKNRTTAPKSFACPVCMGPFYYSLSSLEEAIMLGEGAYYHLCSFRYENEIGHSDPAKLLIEAQPLRTKYMNAFDHLVKFYPDCICGLVFLISSLNSVIVLMDRALRPDEKNKIVFYRELYPALTLNVNNIYKYCMRLLDMTYHESAFLFTNKLEMYYLDIAYAFSFNSNVIMAVKYYKLAYAFALRSNRRLCFDLCKNKLMEEMERLALLPPLRFAVGDEVMYRGGEDEEWRHCEVIELHFRQRDDPLHYCAPYRVKVPAGDGLGDTSSGKGIEVLMYITVEVDSDTYIRRPGWISLEATRFEARVYAKVEELISVYCSKEFVQGIYRVLRADADFCARLQADWKVELSEHMLFLYRLLVMYRKHLIRTASGYHITTADEVAAGIREFFYSDTVDGLERKTNSGDADTSAMLKMADFAILRCPSSLLSRSSGSSPSSKMYRTNGSSEGLSAITMTSYVAMFREEVYGYDDLMAVVQNGLSRPIPSHLKPSLEAMQLITACRSSGHFLQLIDPLLRLGTHHSVTAMYQFVFDLTDPRSRSPASHRESPVVFFFVKYCLDQGMGVPDPLLSAYNDMRRQLSCSFLRCAKPSCEHNKLDKSTGKVKFKKCSRCQAVIYCSRECQVAHYPEHKAQCRKAVDVEKVA